MGNADADAHDLHTQTFFLLLALTFHNKNSIKSHITHSYKKSIPFIYRPKTSTRKSSHKPSV